MALWSNTADGWGSDPSSSGNGALGTYLQSSAASAPKSQSLAQAQDPSNSMPTSSIVRTVQPAASKLSYGSSSNSLVSSLSAPVQTQVAAPVTASRFQADIYTPPVIATPTPVAAPTYGGPANVYVASTSSDGSGTSPGGYGYYYKFNPTAGGYMLVGQGAYQGPNGGSYNGETYQLASDFNPGVTDRTGAAGLQNVNNVYANQVQAFRDANAPVQAQNSANLQAGNQSNLQDYYLNYLSQNGTLPPRAHADNSLGGQDDAARAAALSTYQANKASAAAISKGIAPVDTSTQDAVNRSSLSSLASRFSTNLMGSNIGAMGRLYAGAITDQGGVNKQLSDEDYAARYNQNVSAFTQAVQAQSTLDANATGVKLQSDVQAVGDAVASLQQQVGQLGTQAGQAVQAHLTALQKQLNEYEKAARDYGAASSTAMALAKGVLGAAVGITSIALAPASGGTSLVAGLGVASALAK